MPPKKPRRTADRILDVTLALFNRLGEPNVATSQLCGELSMSPGNLFYHHASRDALVAALFERYEQDLTGALSALSPAAVAPLPDIAPLPLEQIEADLPGASPALLPLLALAQLCNTLATVAWAYRFMFRDINDLVSRHRVLERRLPALLRDQAQRLRQALAALPWQTPPPSDATLALWTGYMLGSLTGCAGLDGALDAREHLRQTPRVAIHRAVGRALALPATALPANVQALLWAHLGQPEALGNDPWWLGSAPPLNGEAGG